MSSTRRRLVDTRDAGLFDATAEAVGRMLRVPVALVTVIGDDEQHFVGRFDEDGPGDVTPRCSPLRESLCRIVEAGDVPLVVGDLAADAGLRDHPAHAELGVRSYLGEPLHDEHGHAIGAVCVVDDAPHAWTQRDRDSVAAMARMVEGMLPTALAAVNGTQDVLPALRHEVGGAVAVLTASVETALVPGLAEDRRRELLEAGARTGRRIADALDAAARLDLRSSLRVEAVDVAGVLDDTVVGHPDERVRVELDRPALVEVDRGLLVLLLRNLVGNAVKHTDGDVVVRAEVDPTGPVRLTVADQGGGITSTTAADPYVRGVAPGSEGLGLGLYLVARVAARIGAHVEVDTGPSGTTFTIELAGPAGQPPAG